MQKLTLSIPAPCNGRIRLLDELKGFAILLIVLYHAGGVLAWENRLHGELGVDLFVTLSGIGLALSNSETSTARFFVRRFLRIFPMYWIVLTGFIIARGAYYNVHYTTADVVVHYLGIQTFLGDVSAVSINDSFWFISFILFAYLFYGFLGRTLVRTDLLLACGAVISFVVTMIFFRLGQAVCFSHFGTRLPMFFVGIVAGRLLRNGSIDIPCNALLALSLALLFYISYDVGIIFYAPILAPVVMALYAFGWKGAVPRFVAEPTALVFSFLGDYSLEIFLLHQPLIREYNLYFQQHVLKIAAPRPPGVIIGMVVAFFVTILLSMLIRALLRIILRSSTANV